MDTTPINENSTLYGDGKPKTGKELQRLISDIFKHHNLKAINLKNIPSIEKKSKQWNRRLLKKAMKLQGAYKQSSDTIFILNVHSHGAGLLELFNKDQLLNWKAYAKAINRG